MWTAAGVGPAASVVSSRLDFVGTSSVGCGVRALVSASPGVGPPLPGNPGLPTGKGYLGLLLLPVPVHLPGALLRETFDHLIYFFIQA